MKILYHSLLTLFAFATVSLTPLAGATVVVTSPVNGETVGTSATYVASSTASTCLKGVASMGVYVDNNLTTVVNSNTMAATIPLTAGSHNTVVQEWDYCGGSTFTPIAVTASKVSGVYVSSPSPNTSVNASPNYVASATSSCSQGVASMGIYVDNNLMKVVNGSQLNTSVTLAAGSHDTVVQEWDYCGGSVYTHVPVNVVTQSGVTVTSPVANSSVNGQVSYAATAASTCSQGVSSMGIYVNNQLVYVTQGNKLNTSLQLSAGAQHTVVQEWDYCGGSTYSTVDLTVTSGGTTMKNLQASAGWDGFGQLPPAYVDCAPCNGIDWALTQNVSSPSESGNAAEFATNGTVPWAVVLWYNPVIGDFSTQGLPDTNQTLVPSLHNFTYDTDIDITNLSATWALEFDVAMYMNSTGMFFGTQCDYLGDGDWDVLNNVTQGWESTGVPCNLTNGWNHLTLQFQRDSNNNVIYQSITLNGTTYNINKTYAPFTVPSTWYGITVNYQMDGNKVQSSNTTYLDNLNFTYW